MPTPWIRPCSEFPNDNPEMHGGAVWRNEGVTGPAACEALVAALTESVLPPPVILVAEAPVEEVAALEAPVMEAPAVVSEPEPGQASEELHEPDPVVPVSEQATDIMVEAPSEVLAAAAEVPTLAEEAEVEQAEVVAAAVEPEVVEALSTDEVPPVVEADDPMDDLEIVDEIPMDDAVDESIPPPAPPAETTADDPFVALVSVMEGVARDAQAGEPALASLRVVLGRQRVDDTTPDEWLALREQASAWQGILRGESEDFSACGASALDEWAATVIARTLGEAGRTADLRRELRRRGVAAFGLVEAA